MANDNPKTEFIANGKNKRRGVNEYKFPGSGSNRKNLIGKNGEHKPALTAHFFLRKVSHHPH